MSIRPYKKPRPHREMCWLLDEKTFVHESGLELGWDQLDKTMQVWASYDTMQRLLWAGHGEAVTWDGKPFRWDPERGRDKWRVSLIRLQEELSIEDALEGLQCWRDWLESYGAAPASSLGGSGISLVKATLEKPLYTATGDLPPIKYTIGGRQVVAPQPQGTPCIFEGELVNWDMQAAYTRVLGNLRYGGRWSQVNVKHVASLARVANTLLFVRARIRIPAQEWGPYIGPLVRRPRKQNVLLSRLPLPSDYPTDVEMQGTWTWEELETAERHGCKLLKLLGAWYHGTAVDQYPFRPWLHAVEKGRAMSNVFGSQLAKTTGNSTWGQFCIKAEAKRRVRHFDGKKIVGRDLPLQGGGNPTMRAYELGEFISGTIRARLYHGMALAQSSLVCAHTDGLWLLGDKHIPGWRAKEHAVRMRLVNPQMYAYRKPEADIDSYTVAGVQTAAAAEEFEQFWKQSYRPRKAVTTT